MVKPITTKERLSSIEGFLYGLRSALTTDEKYSELVEALENITEDLHCVEAEIDKREAE